MGWLTDLFRSHRKPPRPNPPPVRPLPPEPPHPDSLVADLLGRHNVARADAGLRALTLSVSLNLAAGKHAAAMAAVCHLSHQLLGEADFAARIRTAGYRGMMLGENVAAGQESAQQVMTDWMNSPGHRANILRPDFTDVGFGVATGRDGHLYYTADFGSQTAARQIVADEFGVSLKPALYLAGGVDAR